MERMCRRVTQPIFLLSLPRSGSTLLQRMLALHPEIGTAPEPWLMLPLVSLLRERGVYADYDHHVASAAVKGFGERMPSGEQDLKKVIRDSALNLYGKAAADKRYFLDKTPRYHLIAHELLDLFEDGKFIVLFRNPLAVRASIIQTWRHLHIFRIDLYAGLASLLELAGVGEGRVHRLKFEDLINEPEAVLRSLCSYLSIPFRLEMLTDFSEVQFPEGGFGNPKGRGPSGTSTYETLSSEPLSKWKDVLSANPWRRYLARRYLDWIGAGRLEEMGYSFSELQRGLLSARVRWSSLMGDLLSSARGIVSASLETQIVRDKLESLPEWHDIYAHR